MPIRVRCRCGQELVLRYGDWVYVFLGVALLATFVNTLVLVLLFLRFEERRPAAETPARPPEAARDAASERPLAPAVPAGAGLEVPPAAKPLQGTDDSGSPPSRAPAPQPESGGRASGAQPPVATGGPPTRRLRPLEASDASDAFPAESLRVLPGSPERLTPRDGRAHPPAASVEPPVPVADSSGARDSPRREPPLVRLFLLEAGRPAGEFLFDPDPWIREAASRRARPGEAPRAAGPERPPTLAEAGLRDPAFAAVRDGIRSTVEGGLDLVFVVDVTSSMKPLLGRFQAECGPLVAALAWTFPSSRLGAVLYRDRVETVVGFGEGQDVVAAIRSARAEGGGDVPEGLHLALRSALSLGRFAWRRESAKHVVVIADAPPPSAERHGTLALAEQARRQGGYRTHAIYDEDERAPREKTPFFPELARRGGGVARSGAAGRLGPEILSAAFPEEARAALRPVLETLLEIARTRT